MQPLERATLAQSGTCELDPSRVGSIVLVAADEKNSIAVDPSILRHALASTPWADRVPDPVRAHTALTHAVGNAKKGIKDDGVTAAWAKIGLTTGGDRLVYGLLRKTSDADLRTLDMPIALTVEVNRDGTSGLCFETRLDPRPEEVAECERVRARYAKERRFITLSGVRSVVNEVAFDVLHGVRLAGTVAILLQKNEDAEFMRLAPGLALAGMRMIPQEVFDGQRARHAPDVADSLADTVAKLRASCEERLASATLFAAGAKSGFQWETIADRRLEAKALVERVLFFKAFVGIVEDDLIAAIAASEAILNQTEVAAAGGLASLVNAA